MLTAKLLVSFGAPLQFRAGEILLPVQPKPLNTCSLAMVPPSLMSGLLRDRLCALAALMVHAEMRMPPSAAFQTVLLAMPPSPSVNRDHSASVPPLAAIAIFRMVWK